MTKERIVLQIVLGIDKAFARQDDKDAAIAEIDAKITRLIGGVTRMDAYGTWTAGAQSGDYTGDIERDDAYIYTLSLMPDEEESVFKAVKSYITDTVRKYDLPIDHVHVNRYPTTEAIFSISEQD